VKKDKAEVHQSSETAFGPASKRMQPVIVMHYNRVWNRCLVCAVLYQAWRGHGAMGNECRLADMRLTTTTVNFLSELWRKLTKAITSVRRRAQQDGLMKSCRLMSNVSSRLSVFLCLNISCIAHTVSAAGSRRSPNYNPGSVVKPFDWSAVVITWQLPLFMGASGVYWCIPFRLIC